MDFNKSMFDEFTKVMKKVKKGDKESAMIILERKPWGENKHAMVGDILNQITLIEWAIHMLAEVSNISFEEIIKLINLKHENTDHYMLNVYAADIKNQKKERRMRCHRLSQKKQMQQEQKSTKIFESIARSRLVEVANIRSFAARFLVSGRMKKSKGLQQDKIKCGESFVLNCGNRLTDYLGAGGHRIVK